MRKDITVGGKTITMEANAATSYRFKHLFKRDILKLMLDKDAMEEEPDDPMKLAYIMAMQAAREDLTAKTEEDYLKWLEGFDPLDLLLASVDIVGLFNANQTTTAVQKKRKDQQKDS